MDVLQVVVVRVYAGSLMTSLEMAGVSLTLLKLSPDWLPYLGQFQLLLVILCYHLFVTLFHISDTHSNAPGWSYKLAPGHQVYIVMRIHCTTIHTHIVNETRPLILQDGLVICFQIGSMVKINIKCIHLFFLNSCHVCNI